MTHDSLHSDMKTTGERESSQSQHVLEVLKLPKRQLSGAGSELGVFKQHVAAEACFITDFCFQPRIHPTNPARVNILLMPSPRSSAPLS